MRQTRRPSTRLVLAALLVVSLLVAGGLSLFASSDPDGLNRVAQDNGFADTETDHAAGDSPLAGYEASAVDDPKASKALAGVGGALVVLALTSGVTLLVRRRSSAER